MYEHTQHAPIHWLLHVLGGYCLFSVWLAREIPVIPFVMLAAALLFFALGLMFRQLTIRDDGDELAVEFGPWRLFGTRIRYADIRSAERSRSKVIDGWGIHHIPGRGKTYNLWGFDCVLLDVNGRTMRIGSNDTENLLALLQDKLQASDSAGRTV